MANKDTITNYFKLLLEILVKCDIVKLESNSGVMHESVKQERVYLADKKGWGVQSKHTTHWMQWNKGCLLEKNK